MAQYLTGGAASRTPLLGAPMRSVQPFTRTTYRAPATTRTATPTGGGMSSAALAAIQKAKALYAPGGGFGKGVEAGLERGRVKAMASGMQGLVGAGLAGTTMAGTLGKKYEEEVAAPTRLGVEERRAQALAGLEMGEAGMRQGAVESSAQRNLQLYMAELQSNLQREEMTARRQPMAVPVAQARQFPSLYGTADESVPNWMGGGTSWERPDITFAEPSWGASGRWRSEQGYA